LLSSLLRTFTANLFPRLSGCLPLRIARSLHWLLATLLSLCDRLLPLLLLRSRLFPSLRGLSG